MNLEETKKIIENKIEAEALPCNVRSQIKSYIDEKQNVREGFKETFQPLIATQEAVKESIDKEQNAMIKQLQENRKALTEGLNKNRLAITQGFDKMDEVKRWDLSQLPGLEAIEGDEKEGDEKEPDEKEPDENILERINNLQNLINEKSDLVGELIEMSNKELKDENIGEVERILKIANEQREIIKDLQREMKILKKSLGQEYEEEIVEKPKSVAYFKFEDFDKGLNNKEKRFFFKRIWIKTSPK